jgi:hypothetical protein
MKTNLFRKNHSFSKWRMRMMRLALLLLPLLGRGLGGGCVLFAQNGVTVSGLAVNAGTVTFNVSWNKATMPVDLWSDTVWVFVDYNNKGVMERLPLLSGATLTATSPGGKVIEEPGNNKGVWVAGNARSAGSFSATVKLLTAVQNVGGACVYGSNYPPVGEYLSASEISFTGTPEYKVVLERSDKSTYTATVGKNEPLSIPSSEAALSFTDKTAAPGKLGCIPMTGNIDFTVPAIIAKGLVSSFEATPSNFTAPDAAALIYTWSAPEFSPDMHAGATYTTTAPAIPGTYPVALTVSSEGYCDLEASKTVSVIDCIPSTVYDLEVSASGYCEGSAGVTFALSGTDDGNSYQLYKDGMAVGATLEGKSRPATFSGSFEAGTYSAQTVPGGAFCPAEMNGTIPVTLTLPGSVTEAPTICGCADGLSLCNEKCYPSCMTSWTTCYGFTFVSDVKYELGGGRTWAYANAYCQGKGMRLPTSPELSCICKNMASMPAGAVVNSMWSYDPDTGDPQSYLMHYCYGPYPSNAVDALSNFKCVK